MEGISGTVFTHGQTGSGKTHTLQGEDDGSYGAIQLASKEIFDTIKQDDAFDYLVKVSMMEIYNEELVDLLVDPKMTLSPPRLEIKDNAGIITNLIHQEVNSFEEMMQLFRRGDSNKSIGSTNMNHRSSRSHCILKVTVEKRSKKMVTDDDKENHFIPNLNTGIESVTISTLSMVDLAGSESVKQTGATGQQQKEGGAINKR